MQMSHVTMQIFMVALTKFIITSGHWATTNLDQWYSNKTIWVCKG